MSARRSVPGLGGRVRAPNTCTLGLSTAYDYRDEAIAVLAARKPSLHGALLAAKAAGHTHVLLDGTLICTDRTSIPALVLLHHEHNRTT